MIQITPAWGDERAEDVWTLYYYLLYQVLPFDPNDYLPKDEKGCYYYPDGNRNAPRIYPNKVKKRFTLHKYTKKVLEGIPLPSTLETLIELVSKELRTYLYLADSHQINRSNLRNLLSIFPSQQSIQSQEFAFSLNEDTLKLIHCENPESILCNVLLKEVFNYDSFSKLPQFPRFVQLLGVDVCPYCNRAYTSTVRKPNGLFQRQNQIDHYRPKALYPWFALSLLNLIPSCTNCNHKKGDEDDFVLYPYEDDLGTAYRFRTEPISGLGYLIGESQSPDEFRIRIEDIPGTVPIEEHFLERAKHSRMFFGLDELYQFSHNDYVAKLFEQRYIFNDAYIDSLIDSFPEHFHSRADVRRLLYLKDIDESALARTPLAKLTRDIDIEIQDLTSQSKRSDE